MSPATPFFLQPAQYCTPSLSQFLPHFAAENVLISHGRFTSYTSPSEIARILQILNCLSSYRKRDAASLSSTWRFNNNTSLIIAILWFELHSVPLSPRRRDALLNEERVILFRRAYFTSPISSRPSLLARTPLVKVNQVNLLFVLPPFRFISFPIWFSDVSSQSISLVIW